jgi:hypothetical protein
MFDVETEAIRILEGNNIDPHDAPDPVLLAYCLVGPDNLLRVPNLRVRARYVPARDTIEVRRGLPVLTEGYAIMHEVAERHLRFEIFGSEEVERQANALAAALLVPAPALRVALSLHGRTLPQLAGHLRTTESIVALRLGEVTGTPLALVASNWVQTRGDAYGWPDEPELRALARGVRHVRGIDRTELTDTGRRVLLSAEAA